MSKSIPPGFLAEHGQALIDNGYNIVPIWPGKKAPGFDGWQKIVSTKPQLKDWLASGHKDSGVGILTRTTPAIDIDVRDSEAAQRIENFICETINWAPTRVGKAPKRLMLFRTDAPFRKMKSNVYVDDFGDEQAIEILGDGQQFVAYHIHPDTMEPYVWTTADSPLTVTANQLPVLSADMIPELFEFFDELAIEYGWVFKKQARQAAKNLDMDNPFAEDTAPVEMSDDELRNRLMLVANPEDHDHWVKIGMALYHQYDGEELGLQLWHEWSETADNYDKDALNTRWPSLGIREKGRAPVTARYIIKMAQEAVANTAAEMATALRDQFLAARDVVEWSKAANATKEAEIDSVTRSSLVSIAKETRERISGSKIPMAEIKKALSYTPKRGAKTPGWAKNWVYDVSVDRFFSTANKLAATKQGFDAMYDRESMTKADILDGKSTPSASASTQVLNVYKIPVVVGCRYEPGQDAIYTTVEGTFANTYREHEIPEVPESFLPRDIANINRIKKHLTHLLPYRGEARMFLDWLSWVVQNPGDHMNYAVLLQGVEGDGKSFFGMLLRSVMGISNVKMINAKSLEGNFTDWSVGQCVTCVEEVRLIKAQNKYEIINSIKPMITNPIIEVHPKGKPQYNAKNTTSYLLFTNFQDALPLDDDGRRYLVLFSQWQSKVLLGAFKADNPKYYADLYKTFVESAPALRKWLLSLEQSEGFNAKGDAPDTLAKTIMVRAAMPEFIQMTKDIIDQNLAYDVCDELLNVSVLLDILQGRGDSVPSPKAVGSMLTRYGWTNLGQIRVGDARPYIYVKDADKYRDQYNVVDTIKVRKRIEELRDSFDDEL